MIQLYPADMESSATEAQDYHEQQQSAKANDYDYNRFKHSNNINNNAINNNSNNKYSNNNNNNSNSNSTNSNINSSSSSNSNSNSNSNSSYSNSNNNGNNRDNNNILIDDVDKNRSSRFHLRNNKVGSGIHGDGDHDDDNNGDDDVIDGRRTTLQNGATDRVASTRDFLKELHLSSANIGVGSEGGRDAAISDASAATVMVNCSGGIEPTRTSVTISRFDAQMTRPSKIRTTAASSLRSALPPPSPTPTRYWDRDTNTRTLSSVRGEDAGKSSFDEKDEGLCGLRNIGNTCFMNSVIQCLSHTKELTRFLRTHNGMKLSSLSKDQQILYEFSKLIREMWTLNVQSVTPLELKRAFATKHRMFSDYNQQDAQEFLRFFLDSLHGALNTGVKGDHLKIDENLSDNKKADLTWEWYTRQENSLIRDLFVGQLKSTLRCTKCGNTSVTFDPFWDLSVSLPSSSRCKLDACLELFIREEILDGDEMPTCSKCQTRRKCTKSFAIQRFPKYLVIHLKRFSETRWSKLSNIVEFPTGERELNMAPYGSNNNGNVYYSLYAISNHMGSTAGGHYVALCKHPLSDQWHEFNDNIVSDDLSESHLISSSAYILFYERV